MIKVSQIITLCVGVEEITSDINIQKMIKDARKFIEDHDIYPMVKGYLDILVYNDVRAYYSDDIKYTDKETWEYETVDNVPWEDLYILHRLTEKIDDIIFED